jgi:hypothetical protein
MEKRLTDNADVARACRSEVSAFTSISVRRSAGSQRGWRCRVSSRVANYYFTKNPYATRFSVWRCGIAVHKAQFYIGTSWAAACIKRRERAYGDLQAATRDPVFSL